MAASRSSRVRRSRCRFIPSTAGRAAVRPVGTSCNSYFVWVLKARQEVGFEIIYLNQDGSVSTFNGIWFPDGTPTATGPFPGVTWSLSRLRRLVLRGSPITFVMRPCLFLRRWPSECSAFAAARLPAGQKNGGGSAGRRVVAVVSKVGGRGHHRRRPSETDSQAAALKSRSPGPTPRRRRSPKARRIWRSSKSALRELVAREGDDWQLQSRAGELLSFSDHSTLEFAGRSSGPRSSSKWSATWCPRLDGPHGCGRYSPHAEAARN